MRFLKKNFKQLKLMEKKIENTDLPELSNKQESGFNDITIGGSHTKDNLDDDEKEKYDEFLPTKMKSYQPEINETNSFAKDVMPPLGQVRASIGSYSMSKNKDLKVTTPNESGKYGDSAYAPSINMKSIMK